MKLTYILLSLSLGFIAVPAQATTVSDKALQVDKIAEGLGIPWGMAVLPDNTMLVTQRQGKLTLIDLHSANQTDISGVPAMKAEGQGGFLDIALSPDFADSGWIYFTYSKDVDGQGATTLARAKLNDNTLIDWQDLLITESRTTKGQHYGSRIAFDDQGHLFFSIGDRGERHAAQDLQRHNGKILRLNLDGSIPQDNPFIGHDDALPEIWSYGHRNPQGLFYNLQTQQLWGMEHGPRGGDEINLIQAGKNYGWPEASHGKEYYAPVSIGQGKTVDGMENPIQVYVPSIAPSGLLQYQGEAFPQWQGDLFSGAMALQHLNHIKLDNNTVSEENRYLNSLRQRIRNVIESPEGWLYIAADNGIIYRIQPAENQ